MGQLIDMSSSENRLLLPLITLCVAQLVGWGVISFPTVVSREMAADLRIEPAMIFAGPTMFYAATGACAPFLWRIFKAYGARRVMIAGTIVEALGLGLVSRAHSPATYLFSWIVLGISGSAALTTPAHIFLNEIAGRQAARAIATLMLTTGLYSTVFWPLTSVLGNFLGWRSTCDAYVVALLFLCVPLYMFGLPDGENRRIDRQSQHEQTARARDETFYLVVAAITLNAFITFGFSAILLELLKAEGLSASSAVELGSLLGILQISARAMNIVGGKRWDGVTIGVASSAILFLSLVVLLFSQGSTSAIIAFLALYGLGSGALAVARSTIPFVFYDKTEFARALSRIALPLNWMSAVSPPLLISLMLRFGSKGVLVLAIACSAIAIIVLVLLMGRRPAYHISASSQ